MKKVILVIIDGLGDTPIPELGNKTPLEAAKTPNLDWLAKNGVCGSILPWVKRRDIPTSEDTHLALFGYNPKLSNPGRGVLEVLGIGEKIILGDVCLRGNFGTIDKDFKIIDRRAGRIENTRLLIEALNKIKIRGVKIIIKKAFGYRVGIVLRGKGLSDKISSNDPKRTGVKVLKILAKEKSTKFTAEVLNEFLEKAYQALKNHPLNKKREKKGELSANYLLLRGAGKLKKIKNFKEKYELKTAFIAGGTLYKGIGKYLGMREIKVRGATGLKNTDLKAKFLAAKKALEKYDFVFLHIKAADSFAEDGNFFGKKEFIEKIDKNIRLLLNLKDVLIVASGDHSTCSLLKGHCGEPVPILIFGAGKDSVKKFSESECKEGSLGKFPQLKLMPKILKLSKEK